MTLIGFLRSLFSILHKPTRPPRDPDIPSYHEGSETPTNLNPKITMPPPPVTSAARHLLEKAHSISQEFELSSRQVENAVQEFIKLMELGLENDGEPMSMIPTYVTSVPNGTEKGVYLAVDLGGTNFRVCSITLHGDSTFTLIQAKSAIPRALMLGTSKQLFSFLAERIKVFVEEHHADHFAEDVDHHLRLGFTFSFPVDQKAINKGYLIRWTKGFDIKDAVGKDVCALLQTEIDLLNLPIVVAALVNDTVGTLMARSYTSPGKAGTLLGAIFGTGTNGAYVEKLEKIKKMTTNPKTKDAYGKYDSSTGEMVVNTEWGSFDNALKVLPDTSYDRALDSNSVNPGVQMFEKRVSGMFLGEILRNSLLALKDEAGLFSSSEISIKANSNIYIPWTIDTSFLSNLETDDSKGLTFSRNLIASDLGVEGATESDAEAIRIVARAIGRRSARLSAIPIAAIVIQTKLSNEKPKPDEGVALEEVQTGLSNLSVNQVANTVKNAFEDVKEKVMEKTSPTVHGPPAESSGVPVRFRSQAPAGSSKEKVVYSAESVKRVTGYEDKIIDIGVDGSVVEYYPGFERYLREALREVKEIGAKNEKRIRIGIAKDGSGVGAALSALVASV